jgi:hypothetical protein
MFDVNESKVKVYDTAEEKISWTGEKIPNPVFMSPLYDNGFIYIADNTGFLYKYSLKDNSPRPDILKIETGVIVNLLIKNDFLYFLANNGYFYSVNSSSFEGLKMIMKVENNPDINKFLTKKLLLTDDEILFCSDSGKLFIYDLNADKGTLADIADNIQKSPLISSPVMIGNVIFIIDQKSNIYKRYRDIK